MKLPKIERPCLEVEVHSVPDYLRAFAKRAVLVFTFPHRFRINLMVGEKKLGEHIFWVFPKIRIKYRRE